MLSSYWCGLPYPVAFVLSLIHSCWLKAASTPVYLSLMEKKNPIDFLCVGGVCGFRKANMYTKWNWKGSMLTSPSPDSLGIHLGLWGLAQSYIRVEDCVGFCICLSLDILFAAVMPSKRPRTDSTVPGAAQSSQQAGPALCTAAWAVVLAWPQAAEGRRGAHSGRQWRGRSSQCAGTEAGGGLNTGGFPRREA